MFYAWNRGNLAAGPVWAKQVGDGAAATCSVCLTSAAYDYIQKRLFVASNTTTSTGSASPGAVRAVDPSTGAYLWQQPLDCVPLGSPTINDTTGIVAVPTYGCSDGKTPSVQLFSEATGAHLATLPRAARSSVGPCSPKVCSSWAAAVRRRQEAASSRRTARDTIASEHPS